MRSTHASTLLLLLAGIMAGVWMYCAQAGGAGWADDFPYSHTLLPGSSENDFFNCAGPHLTSAAQLPEAFSGHYHAVNGRLANMLAFTFSLLPTLLTVILHGAAFIVMLAAMLRLSFGPEWRRHYLALALIAAGVWVILPWHENLASSDYYINYVWSAGLNLMFLSLTLRPSLRMPQSVLCVMAAAAALMHEGMSAAIDTGIFIFILINRGNYINLPPLCIYMLFSLVPLMSPGIWELAGRRTSEAYTLGFFYRTLGIKLMAVWITAGVALLRFVKRRKFDREEIVIWTTIFTGIAVCIVARQGGRALWLPLALSISLMLRYVQPHLSRRTKMAATILCAIIFCGWGSLLCSWQYYASCERNTLLAGLRAGRNVIYMDLIMPDELPWPLMLTVSHVNGDQTIRANLSAEVYADDKHTFAVLPSSWKNKKFTQIPAIPGNANARGGAYTFLAERPIREALYTHRTAAGTVALNPLLSLPKRLFHETASQQVLIESTPVSPGLWVCRPIFSAPSLLGFPVVAIDTVGD